MTYENWPPQSHAFGCHCARCRRGEPLIDRLADQTLSTALRHAQNRAEYELDLEDDAFQASMGFEVATPAGKVELPGRFGGWTGAVTLPELFSTSNPPSTLFTSKPNPSKDGFGLLYRIYDHGKHTPLYIGMALTKSIRTRVASHLKGLLTKKNAISRAPAIKSMGAKGAADIYKHIAKMAAAAGAVPKQDPVPKDPFTSEIEKLRILAADPSLNAVKVQYGKVTSDTGYPLTAKFLHAYEAALQVIEKPRSYVGSARTFEEVIEEAFEEAF